jgi:uncharacterized protein YndB with AHSA1/START domain
MIKNGNQVHHTQDFSVPVGTLFNACLRGDLLKQCAGDLLQRTGNFAVGERYNCEIKGGTDYIRGDFKKIVPNQMIVFTWETLAGDESTGETTITLTFAPSGTGSSLRLVQENIATPSAAEDQDEGWAYNLQTLAKALK